MQLTSVPEILEQNPSAFLIDASGVLYDDFGPTPNVGKTIREFKKKAPVYLVTNNSCHDPDVIANRLYEYDIPIPATDIISSGHTLSELPELRSHIENKTVYLVGKNQNSAYVKLAAPKTITSNIEEAETVILAASYKGDGFLQQIQTVISALKKRPTLTVIACNPDRYIWTGKDLYPVIGYYADKIAQTTQDALLWAGKPLPNFSNLVQSRLKKAGITTNSSVWFFDDNAENVINMANHIGISGCFISETGLGNRFQPHQTGFFYMPRLGML